MDGFFEGGFEGGDEVVGEVADEADGVGEEDFGTAFEFPGAGFGVEGGEEFVVGVGAGCGECVEEGGLSGVGVSDDADGEVLASAFGDEAGFAFGDAFDFGAEVADAFADEAAVGFELGFTGAARADTAAGEGVEVAPHAGEAGVGVLHLGELDLELGFVGAGAGGEDVEDEFGAVEDFDARGVGFAAGFLVDDFFESADLGGREVVIEEDDVGGVEFAEVSDLFGFAAADVQAGVWGVTVLEEGSDDACAGGFGEAAEFAEGVAGVCGGAGEDDADEEGAFLFD